MVWKTCRWLFSVEFVLATFISNMWPPRPGSVEETLPPPSMRNDWSHLSHLQPCWRLHCLSQDPGSFRISLAGSLPIELSMPVLTKFLWHNQGSVAPLDDVPLENGRSLRCRPRVDRTSGTLSSDPISFLSGSPSAVMSAQCFSLPRRKSSESSCIQLHVWRQILTRTQIVSFLPRTRSPLSTQTASPHQSWAPSRLRSIYTGFSPGLHSGRRCRLAPVHLSSLARVRSPR